MKKLLVIVAIAIISSANAQTAKKTNPQFEITKSQIETVQKNGKTVQFVNPVKLKNGYNYMSLKTGDVLYVEYKNKQIKSFKLTNSKGVIIGKPVVITTVSQFQCSQNFCICSGNQDCNDMFTTNVCGPDAVCFGEMCACYR